LGIPLALSVFRSSDGAHMPKADPCTASSLFEARSCADERRLEQIAERSGIPDSDHRSAYGRR
jgi:hypothetical protein